MDIVTLALAKSYTKKSLAGAGAVKGKNCQIQSQSHEGANTKLVFAWYNGSDVLQTTTVLIPDGIQGERGEQGIQGVQGEQGEAGVGVSNVELLENNALKFTLSDGSTLETDPIPTVQGEKGEQGEQGDDGFAPTVEVKEATESRYVLTITTADGSFDTPNLKGGSGGGGGGTSDYADLDNKPKINDVELNGNKTLAQLGIAAKDDLESTQSDLEDVNGDVETLQSSASDHESRITALETAPVVNPIQFDVMPEASADYNIVQYVGADTTNFKRGFFYRSTPSVVSGSVVYDWVRCDVQPSNLDYSDLQGKPKVNGVELDGEKTASQLNLQSQFQHATMPEATADNLGAIVQYTGATTTDFTQGFFYQCVYDSDTTAYKWQYKAAGHDDSARVTLLESNQGDMSQLSATTLVGAINALSRHDIKSFTYEEPNLIITYNDDTTVSLSLLAILNETQLGELANVLDSTIADTNVLQYDAALKAYKPYAIVQQMAALLQEAKDYTDTAVQESVKAGALVCDEKPEYDADNDTVIYKQGGQTKTTTQTDTRFYYKDSDGQSFCTSWIEDIEFTFSVAEVNFENLVAKDDLVDDYTGEEVDKTKVPTIASLDALVTLLRTNYLANYVLKTDIIDNLLSQDGEKALSAKQGYILKALVDNKQDIVQLSALPIADEAHLNKVYQTVPNGKWWRCEYDSEADEYKWTEIRYASPTDTSLDATSVNPVTNKAITEAFGTLQTKALSTEIAEASTVETALASLETLHNANATTIENHTETLSELQIQLNKDHAVNVTLYDTEAAKPTAIDFENGIVTSVGASAYCLDTKKWYRVKAVDAATLAITWEEFDGLGSKLVAGNGISIDESTGAISSDIVEFHGTHDEWDAFTEEEQAKYNARDFTDDADDDDTLKEEIAALTSSVEGIEAVIPSGATADNKLVTNSDTEMAVVQTNSATWIKITFDEAWKYPLLLGVYSSHWGAGVVVSIEQRNVVELSSGSGTHITSPAYYHGSAAPYYYYIQVRSHGTIPLFVTNVSRTPGITIEALSETPDVSDLVSVPVKQLVTALTTSDLTSTVSSGSTAPITSGGVYDYIPTGTAAATNTNTFTFSLPTLRDGDVYEITVSAQQWNISSGFVTKYVASRSGTNYRLANCGGATGGYSASISTNTVTFIYTNSDNTIIYWRARYTKLV